MKYILKFILCLQAFSGCSAPTEQDAILYMRNILEDEVVKLISFNFSWDTQLGKSCTYVLVEISPNEYLRPPNIRNRPFSHLGGFPGWETTPIIMNQDQRDVWQCLYPSLSSYEFDPAAGIDGYGEHFLSIIENTQNWAASFGRGESQHLIINDRHNNLVLKIRWGD